MRSMLNKPPSALNIALRLLARREHSAQELRSKLAARGCEPDAVSATLAELARRGWQSDDRYARAAVSSGARKGHGPLRIRLQLNRAGVDAALTAEQLASHDLDWQQEAHKAAEKYLRGKDSHDLKTKAKLQTFLLRRGFSSDQIRATMKAIRLSVHIE